jgi:hypothetical protein
MTNKKIIVEGYQPLQRGYQPTQQKPQTGVNVELGYQPPTTSEAKPAPNPPPKKP